MMEVVHQEAHHLDKSSIGKEWLSKTDKKLKEELVESKMGEPAPLGPEVKEESVEVQGQKMMEV
jgi:hypothetical protein